MTRSFVCWMTIGTALAFSAMAQAQSAAVVVSARANIYGAGHTATDDPTGTGGGDMPPIVSLTQAGPSLLVISAITGSVTTDGARSWHGPTGYSGSSQSIAPWRGLSGLLPTMWMGSLTGVFLDANEPSGEAPPSLNFDYWAYVAPDIFPQLRQVFLITDETGGRIRVPAGATRLALGFADSAIGSGLPGSYSDNEGAVQVIVDIGPLTAAQPATWGAVKSLYRN